MGSVAPEGQSVRQRKGSLSKQDSKAELKPDHALVADDKAIDRAITALFIACFVDACVGTILGPNYATLVSGKNVHKDAFEDLPGVESTAALYILQGGPMFAAGMSSLYFSPLSDKIGRKPLILMSLYVSVLGTILKFVMRDSFWGFVAASTANGIFGVVAPVGTAYIGDVYKDDPKKAEETMGGLMALQMMGGGLGGIIAILTADQGLFFALLPGAAVTLITAVYVHKVLVEPNKSLQAAAVDLKKKDDDVGGDAESKGDGKPNKGPEKLDTKLLGYILGGAVLDNIGSTGMQMALFPVCFNQYVLGPQIVQTVDQPLSDDAFKWLMACYIFAVIPGVILGSMVTEKYGNAFAFALGNLFTAFFQVALLVVGVHMKSDTTGMVLFLVFFLGGYPMTVISQLTTGPMLDAIAPEHRRAEVQGYSTTIMNVVMSFFPIILGKVQEALEAEDGNTVDQLLDYYDYQFDANGTIIGVAPNSDFQEEKFNLGGEATTIIICVAFSLIAIVGNMPLCGNPLFGPRKEEDENLIGASDSDADIIKKAENGEWVPASELDRINEERMKAGQPFLKLKYGTYEKDKPRLWRLRAGAAQDFEFMKQNTIKYLEIVQDKKAAQELMDMANASRAKPEEIKAVQEELGKWFTDYLHDNGYWVDDNPSIIKEMIMTAFPRVSGPMDTLKAEDMEASVLNGLRAINKIIKSHEPDSYSKLLKNRPMR